MYISLSILVIIFFTIFMIVIIVGIKWYHTVVFICISLINNVVYFTICLLMICIPSWRYDYSYCLPIFERLLTFLLLSCNSYFYILNTSSLSDRFANILCHSVSFLFSLMTMLFIVQKDLLLWCSIYLFFFCHLYFWCHISEAIA